MSRDTSFYYSFLVLPVAKRRAIVAVWDFCRAVDDAVDEVAPESRRGSLLSEEARAQAAKSLAGWRAELKEVYEGTPTTPQGQALQPFVHRFNLPQLQFEALIDGVEMDLSYHRYPSFEPLLQVPVTGSRPRSASSAWRSSATAIRRPGTTPSTWAWRCS